MATITEQLQSHTSDIIKAKKLLEELSDRVGKYVWKRITLEQVEVTNPVLNTNGASTSIKVTSDAVDLTLVDTTFFDGFITATDYYFYVQDGELYYHRANKGDFLTTYDPKTQILSNGSGAEHSDTQFTYTGTKIVYQKTDEVAMVVADTEDAYPDGEMQDGAYYVKFDPLTAIAENIREGVNIWGIIGTLVTEGLAASDFGCTKYAIDKFTFSSKTDASTKVAHSLGDYPKLAFLIANPSKKYNYHVYYGMMYNNNVYDRVSVFIFYETDGGSHYSGAGDFWTDTTQLRLTTETDYYYYSSGVEYTLITMA